MRQPLKPSRPLVREQTCLAVVLLHIVGVTARIFWRDWGRARIRGPPFPVLAVNAILSLPDDNCAAETSQQDKEAEQLEG